MINQPQKKTWYMSPNKIFLTDGQQCLSLIDHIYIVPIVSRLMDNCFALWHWMIQALCGDRLGCTLWKYDNNHMVEQYFHINLFMAYICRWWTVPVISELYRPWKQGSWAQHGAHLGPIGPHVGPMNFAIWGPMQLHGCKMCTGEPTKYLRGCLGF